MEYYRTFSNVLTIRTVRGEYLIAMKLKSWRPYKKDRSDVIGILMEHSSIGQPITLDMIKRAVINLYGEWEAIPELAWKQVEESIEHGDYKQQYKEIRDEEQEANKLLVKFEKDYPGKLNGENVEDVLATLKSKKEKPSVLQELK